MFSIFRPSGSSTDPDWPYISYRPCGWPRPAVMTNAVLGFHLPTSPGPWRVWSGPSPFAIILTPSKDVKRPWPFQDATAGLSNPSRAMSQASTPFPPNGPPMSKVSWTGFPSFTLPFFSAP
ncbi:hypothetical protein GCM10023320_34370 [Pseudonocardia adelaidensis]|uniref:Uncharacterized protein n=1 Tax=Pseudonocardia adelaidensis TaxID=648754 RepID=A0ABP9NJG0_9PSEU